MGSVQCRETIKSPNEKRFLVSKLKSYLKGNKNETNETSKIKNHKINTSIKSRSNFTNNLHSTKVIELSADILASVINDEMSKVHNSNIYISMLFPDVYEYMVDEKNIKSNAGSINQNLDIKATNKNIPISFMSNNINKINDIFNLKNELFSNENKHFLSSFLIKQVFNTNLSYVPTMPNLNASHNSNINELLLSEALLSRQTTHRYSLKLTNTIKSIKELEEAESSLKIKSTSVKNTNTTNVIENSKNKRYSIDKIKEFNLENEILENDYELENTNEERSENKKKLQMEKNENIIDENNTRKNPSRNKRLSYSVNLRKKIINKRRRTIDGKDGGNSKGSQSPFDLFSSRVMNPNKTGKENLAIPIENKLENNLKLDFNKNLKEKKKKKPNFHFSINLKVIIKQEIKESLENQRVNYKNKKTVSNKKKIHNYSGIFKDSIDKYLNFENSVNYKIKRTESCRKSRQICSNKNTNELNDGEENKDLLEILSKISLSNYEEKLGNIQFSQILDTIENLKKRRKDM